MPIKRREYISWLCDVKILTSHSLDEGDVLDGDIYGMIAPYATANLWVSAFLS